HDGSRRAQPVQPRNVDVHGDHVGPERARLLHCLDAVGGLADDGEGGVLAQQGDEGRAQGGGVVGYQHADGPAAHAAPFRREITVLTSESSRPETHSFLVRNPSAPTAMPRCRSESESRADTSRMGIESVSARCRTAAVSSYPSISSMPMSQTMTS